MFHKIVTRLEIAKYIYKAKVTVVLKILNSSIYFLFKWLGNLPQLIKNSEQSVLCEPAMQRCERCEQHLEYAESHL